MATLIIGFIGATLTTISFLPQVIKVVKTKSTKDISLGMFIAMTAGILCWLIYGLLTKDIVVIFANAISIFLSSIILIYKIKE